jgi:hypothetical protein
MTDTMTAKFFPSAVAVTIRASSPKERSKLSRSHATSLVHSHPISQTNIVKQALESVTFMASKIYKISELLSKMRSPEFLN